MATSNNRIAQHYGSAGLADRIVSALKQDGKDTNALTVEDLAPVDQFHTRGLAATRDLIKLADAKPGWRVLDVGSGLGGPARALASHAKCHVTGVDITKEFCEVATLLSRMTRLDQGTDFRHGDATALPFADGQFDLALTMQIQMNIEDKRRFYGEIFRVLTPGARFVFQDVMSGGGGEIHLPVPWATRRESSFLITVDALRQTLEETGFQIELLEDTSEEALAWRKNQPAAAGLTPSVLGLHVVMGEQYSLMQSNQVRNLEERRVAYVRGAVRKPQ
ncbi:MAG: class I SAM-dependent methyltransferase [Betaproteobacteria bacterium]